MKKVLFTVLMILVSLSLFASVSRQDAVATALSDAGASEAEVSRLRSGSDRDDGRQIFEVEFNWAGYEYEYDVDAESGDIIKVDIDLNSRVRDTDGQSVSEEEAVQKAYQDAGVSQTESLRVRLGRDDGRSEYSIVFLTDSWAYDYQIDANTGVITDVSKKRISTRQSEVLGLEEAASLVLERIEGASRDDMRIHQDRDDGRITYEGEVFFDGYEYEFEIDGATGRFLDWERERAWR